MGASQPQAMGRSAASFLLLMVTSKVGATTSPSPPPPDMREVSIYMEPCLADPYVGLQCMLISKPYYFLFVHGICVDNLSQETVRAGHAPGVARRIFLPWTPDTMLLDCRLPKISTASTSTRPGTARAMASGSTTTGASSASPSLRRSATTTWAWATRTPRRPPTARARPVQQLPAPSCSARLLYPSQSVAFRACRPPCPARLLPCRAELSEWPVEFDPGRRLQSSWSLNFSDYTTLSQAMIPVKEGYQFKLYGDSRRTQARRRAPSLSGRPRPLSRGPHTPDARAPLSGSPPPPLRAALPAADV